MDKNQSNGPKRGEIVRRDSLKKVKFGNSDMMVTECCIGTMTWGSFNADEAEAHAQLDKGIIDLGSNFLDTAELYPVAFNYGKTTEAWIGNWLSARVKEGKLKREDIYIATKCNAGGIGGAGGWGEGEKPPGGCHSYEPEVLERSCKASIERMQCGYIDLYQLHWPSRDVPIFGCASFYPEGTNRPMSHADKIPAGQPGYDVFERQCLGVKKLLDAGLIKYWGLSNENAFGITMFCITADKLGMPRPVSCQNDFSLVNRIYEGDTWEAAYRFGVVGLPYGILSGGVLSGKYMDGTKWSKAAAADRPLDQCRMRVRPGFQPRYGIPMAMKATAEYVALAEEYGISPTELAIAWANQRPCNCSLITGTTTVKQVEEYVEAFKLELPADLMARIDAVNEHYRSPTQFYHNKDDCFQAAWLGQDARHAKDPDGVTVAAAL